MLASSRKTSLMASASRSSTRFETTSQVKSSQVKSRLALRRGVAYPAHGLLHGRRLVVSSGHCAGTYLIPFYLEGGVVRSYHDCCAASPTELLEKTTRSKLMAGM